MRREPEYVAHDLQKAFAEEPGLAELEVVVTVEEGVIHLAGSVASEEHRVRLIQLAEQRYPDFEVVDELETDRMDQAGGSR